MSPVVAEVAPGAGGAAAMPRGIMTCGLAEVALEELDLRFAPLRLIAPPAVARLKAAVVRDGIRQPVLVATEVEPGRRVLLDGFKRVRVARELTILRLSATLLALDAPMALATMLRANATQPGLSALEEGWIVRRLCREYGLTQAHAGELVGHDQSWVCHRLRLAEQLDPALQEDLRLGLLPPAAARELGRLPRGEQLRAAEVAHAHGLTSRQVARLARQLVAAVDPGVRLAVLADPLRFLAPGADAPPRRPAPDPRLSAGGNELRRALVAWEGAAWRLGRSLLTQAPTGLRAAEARVLAPLLGQALQAGRGTLERLAALVAAPGEPDGPP